MNVLKLFRTKISRTYFRKSLLIFTLVTAFAVAISSFLVANTMSRTVYDSLYDNSKILLAQVKQMTDSLIVAQSDQIVTRNFLLRGGDYFRFFESKSGQDSLVVQNSVYNGLFLMADGYSYVDSISLYNNKAGVLVSSDIGVMYTQAWKDSSSFYFNIDEVTGLLASDSVNRWYSPENPILLTRSANEEGLVTFVYAIPSVDSTQRHSCVIIRILPHYFANYIGSGIDGAAPFLVVGGNGGKIASFGSVDLSDENINQLRETVHQSKQGVRTIKTDSANMAAAWMASDINDWVYISLMPTGAVYAVLYTLYSVSAFIILIVMLVTAVVIYFAAVHLHRPIGQLENENIVLIRDHLLTDLLNAPDDYDELQKRFALIGMDIADKLFTLVFLEVENIFDEKNEYEILLSQATVAFRDCFEGCLFLRHDDILVFLVVGNDDIGDSLFALRADLEVLFDVSINIVYTEATKNVLELHEQYRKLSSYMQYSFIYGFGNVFVSEQLEIYENSTAKLPESVFCDIESALASGDAVKLKELFRMVAAQMRSNSCSYRYMQNYLLHIVNLFSHVLKKNVSDDDTRHLLTSRFAETRSLDDFVIWLSDLANTLPNTATENNATSNTDFIQTIADYIVDNISGDLTLKSVAERFGISSSYLSRIFKTGHGVNFSLYLKGKKFEKAAEQLINSPNMKIKDISEQLGYYNVSFFSQQFREKYGMSPQQYRKAHLQ